MVSISFILLRIIFFLWLLSSSQYNLSSGRRGISIIAVASGLLAIAGITALKCFDSGFSLLDVKPDVRLTTFEIAENYWTSEIHFSSDYSSHFQNFKKFKTTPKGALISLVYENELHEMIRTVGSFDASFNSQQQYDWIFFSPEDLSDVFRNAVSNITIGTCIFEKIESINWKIPESLNSTRVSIIHENFENKGLDRNWILQMQHISRWNAGLFANEKRLNAYKLFWRIDPGVSK